VDINQTKTLLFYRQRKSIKNKINNKDLSNIINKTKIVNNIKINNMDTMKNENLTEKKELKTYHSDDEKPLAI